MISGLFTGSCKPQQFLVIIIPGNIWYATFAGLNNPEAAQEDSRRRAKIVARLVEALKQSPSAWKQYLKSPARRYLVTESEVEESFRTLKTPLEIQPVYHWSQPGGGATSPAPCWRW
jgi:hypothetical protein